MTPLPETLPCWYTVKEGETEAADKGWTPKTCHIVRQRENDVVTNAWNGSFYPPDSLEYTVSLSGLQVISPLQVGGGSFPEGGILPAQVGGVAWIPGSSIRGAMLSWLRKNWQNLPPQEKGFWETLVKPDCSGWQPRKIRFESVFLKKELEAFPLNAQQPWQVFDETSNKLGVQWQVSPVVPPTSPKGFSVRVLLANPVGEAEKKWLKTALETMLKQQGIGRGTASGFGRIATSFPLTGTWEIALKGTKPAVQQQVSKEGQILQRGIYRWSPQVLRACLRGYFTRVALSLLTRKDAETLTSKIFGGFGSPAELTLTSYLTQSQRGIGGTGYVNIPAADAHSTWIIKVDCTPKFHDLVDNLLNIACRIGGLGPGWRRPPHVLERFGGYRGSEFTLTKQSAASIDSLIKAVQNEIRRLAAQHNLQTFPQPRAVNGGIVSIWQGKQDAWWTIVHGVCSTQNNNRKPDWCGSSETRPSGYAVREYKDCCWITVFDQAVEATLKNEGFTKIWST